MKMVIVSIKDMAADCFARPYFVASVGVALRSFGDEVLRDVPENPMFAHPEHFVLYKLGFYDDATGLFECGAPEQLALAVDFKPKANVALRAVN